MKRKLIILFDEYPFEPGEYSFIQTELEMLVAHFEVSIISLSPSAEQKMMTDKRISVYHCVRTFGTGEKLKAVFKFLASRHGRREIGRILKSGQSRLGRLYDAIVYFGSAEQLRSFVRKNRLLQGDELVYSYWFNANCLAFLMDKEKYPDMKVVSRIHGYDLYNERNPHSRQPFREYMDEGIDTLFFVADAGLQYYMERWGKAEDIGDKYRVARIGTTDGSFHEDQLLSTEKKQFCIVSCSDIIPLKRVDLLIEGLAQITDMEIEWIHFGAGSRYDEMRKYAEELLSHKGNISYEMPGFMPVEEIKRFYVEHFVDCFLTTSSTEGCPVSIQEAMSCGIPIIATAVGEVPNMIAGNGILLPENPSPEEIQEAVACLYSAADEEIKRMRERSRALWEMKYDAVENGEKFIKLLQSL